MRVVARGRVRARFGALCHETDPPITKNGGRVSTASRGGKPHMLTRRSIVAAGLLAPVAARAQTSPSSGMIRIINPFPAGGTSDAMARLLQPALQQRLGATVIVENRPGASASIGATVVAKSPPDGSTWLLTSETFLVSTLLLAQSALRCAEGFRAGDDDRARTDGAVRASLAALSHAAGTRRRGEGQARHADLRDHRPRQQRASHGGRVVPAHGHHGWCMCPIGAPRRC